MAALLVALGFCAEGLAATRYDGDGVLSGKTEAVRWYINRARFGPEMEADRLRMTNSTPGGHPDYDACEDVDGTNDFGDSAAQWAPWIAPKPPLAPCSNLIACAQNHCRDMAETGVFSHYSPSANYYPLNSSPFQRMTNEHYTYNAAAENIAAGSTGWYTPADIHSNLFEDGGISNRGHRTNILDYKYNLREIGVGFAGGGGWDYYTEDFGRRSSNHFFTCTLFNDANTNRMYNEGEGVGNVQVHLWNGTNEALWYDESQASGSFAIPINDLPDGAAIEVELRNTNASSKRLTLPLGYNTLGLVELSNNESFAYGTFVQPLGTTNVGLRNVTPYLAADIVVAGTNAVVPFDALGRVTYRLEYCDDGSMTNWFAWSTLTVTNQSGAFTSGIPPAVNARSYRVVLTRE